MKIPGIDEKRKPKAKTQTVIRILKNGSTIENLITPPSYKQILKEKRFWTTNEISQIIELQKKTQNTHVQLRNKDFKKLWELSDQKCAITNMKFGIFNSFDIGIDVIDLNAEYSLNNFRLVLFPLSYSKLMFKRRSKPPLTDITSLFDDDPLIEAIFIKLHDEIYNSSFCNMYPLAIRFIRSTGLSIMYIDSMVYKIPEIITNRSYEVLKENNYRNNHQVCSITITQKLTVVAKTENNTSKSFDLYDPAIDCCKEIVNFVNYAHMSKLRVRACAILEDNSLTHQLS